MKGTVMEHPEEKEEDQETGVLAATSKKFSRRTSGCCDRTCKGLGRGKVLSVKATLRLRLEG